MLSRIGSIAEQISISSSELYRLAEKPYVVRRAAITLVVIHITMLAWICARQSPTWDEVGHLPAGISHWQHGHFGLYRVNPPLVRMVAALPVLASSPKMYWTVYDNDPRIRMEALVGREFVKANGVDTFWLFAIARWACIPFSVLGAYTCFRWAADLYGPLSGLTALLLWCFSPNIIAFGALITPDLGASAVGIAAGYAYWKWLKHPSWPKALMAGGAFGFALLTKTTWVVLFGLWPIMFVSYRILLSGADDSRRSDRYNYARSICQFCVIVLLATYLLNGAYLFEGSFVKLGDYSFVSTMFRGSTIHSNSDLTGEPWGNRFRDTRIHNLMVPLPKNYVQGIDAQAHDFEQRFWSYLRGEWRQRGWWYYYLYAVCIKVPLGNWILMVMAAVLSVGFKTRTVEGIADELCLLAPVLTIFGLVSSQTGFNHHMRYVLPTFPFMFVWISKVTLLFRDSRATEEKTAADRGRPASRVESMCLRHWNGMLRLIAAFALVWSITSSLWIYPHSLSYFNELVGGPLGGGEHLIDSNIDWGQDLLYLARWLKEHPEAHPFFCAYVLEESVDPRIAGIGYDKVPSIPAALSKKTTSARRDDSNHLDQLRPGWYAVSVFRLHWYDGRYNYFQQLNPAAMAGYGIYIYHVSENDVQELCKQHVRAFDSGK